VDQFVFHPLLPAGHEFLYGLVLVLVVLFLPGGFWGALRRSP
jgi:ABC-type branched-subunit amino acid transport system permease subunit